MTVIVAILCAAFLIGAVLLGVWQINRAKSTPTDGSPRSANGGKPKS